MIIVGNTWLLWTHPTFMGTGSILGLSAAEEPEEQPTIVKEVNIIFQQTDGGGVEHGIRRFQGVELDSRRSAQEFGLSLRLRIHICTP